MSKLAQYINRHIVGNVFDTPTVCAHYANDRSILEYRPRLVAFPKTTTDIRKLVRFSHQLATKGYDLPITVRGSGLDTTGAAIGSGLLISTACLNRIEEIDLRGRLVRVQPGVTLGDLNQALSLHGLWLPISTHPKATIGGIISNALHDNLSYYYGGISACVERIEFVLSDGTITEFAPYSSRSVRHLQHNNTTEAKLYRQLGQLLDRHADLLQPSASTTSAKPNRSATSPRYFTPSLAGYPYLNQIRTKHQWNLLPLVFGSQGTLGVITDIILHVELLPPTVQRLAATFHDLSSALRFLEATKPLAPRTAKLTDLRIFHQAAKNGIQPEFLGRKIPQGWLVQLSFAGRAYKTNRKLRRCLELLPTSSHTVVEDATNVNVFKQLDSALTAYLNTEGDHSPIISDAYIAPEKLPDFVAGLALLEQTLGCQLPLFGSYLTNNYQVRPGFNYQELSGREDATNFLRQYLQLIADCDGTASGGTPEGRLKLMPTSTSDTTKALAAAVKTTFDPYNIFNPDVKLGAELSQSLRHLRTHNHSGVMTP